MGELVKLQDFQSHESGYIVSIEETPDLIKAINQSAGLVLEGKTIGDIHVVDTSHGTFQIVVEPLSKEDEDG